MAFKNVALRNEINVDLIACLPYLSYSLSPPKKRACLSVSRTKVAVLTRREGLRSAL